MNQSSAAIVFVCPHYPTVGGVEYVTGLLVDYMRSASLQVRILTLKSPVEWSGDRHADLLVQMPGRLNSSQNRIFIRDYIREMGCTCVINQGSFSFCYLDKKDNPNTVFINTFHGMPFWEWNSVRTHSLKSWIREKTGKEPLFKELLRWCISRIHKTWAYPSLKAFYRNQIEQSSCYVVLNETYKKTLEYVLYKGIAQDKIVTIPNPLPELTTKACEKEAIVLYVGRLSRNDKRVDRLLCIWKRVESKVPGWKLQLVGSGEDKDSLEKLSQKLQLERVEFLGYQPSEPFYRKASVLCVTSSFEGGPLVIPEAQRCATVPIAFGSSPSIRSMIDSGKTGLLIRPFDEVAYANALIQLLTQPEQLKCMAEQAEAGQTINSITTIGTRWLSLINNL